MKRYERLSKDENMEYLMNKMESNCNDCEIRTLCNRSNDSCAETAIYYLNEEIQPRWTLIKSNDDLDKLWVEFIETTYEIEFKDWLKQEIGVNNY